jgi:hypothetical protein
VRSRAGLRPALTDLAQALECTSGSLIKAAYWPLRWAVWRSLRMFLYRLPALACWIALACLAWLAWSR